MLFSPGLVPGPLSFDLQSVYVPRGRYEDALASSTEPCGFGCAYSFGLFDLQSADFLCFFIRNLRYACIVFIGFFNEEYLIASVDFIVALRRTKGRGRRTLRSPPSPSSGLHLIHPGCPLRRGITAAAGLYQFRQLVSGAGRLSPVPNFIWLSVFGLRSFAFQSGCWAIVVRFSLLEDRLFVPAATWCFCYSL